MAASRFASGKVITVSGGTGGGKSSLTGDGVCCICHTANPTTTMIMIAKVIVSHLYLLQKPAGSTVTTAGSGGGVGSATGEGGATGVTKAAPQLAQKRASSGLS